VRIEAVADRNPERLDRARRLLGDGIRTYRDIDDLLERETPAFVDVATPPAVRAEIIGKAAVAGSHVLAEKPLAVSAQAMRAIAGAAARCGVAVMTVHNWHYAPALRLVREAVEKGTVGNIRAIEFRTHRTQPAGGRDSWRLRADLAGGGILTDHGWHALYLAQSLVQSRPASVTARVATRRWSEGNVEDTAWARFVFGGGVRVSLDLTWAAERRETHVRVLGDRGSVEIADGDVVERDTAGAVVGRRRAGGSSDDSYHAGWFPPVLDGFIAALEHPSLALENYREAAACRAALDAAYASARAGGAVTEVDGHEFLSAGNAQEDSRWSHVRLQTSTAKSRRLDGKARR
ncbi:MAG: gfo/Idh/MocA family oxidoreductase, partial [Deltaproteobacteria bacterium]